MPQTKQLMQRRAEKGTAMRRIQTQKRSQCRNVNLAGGWRPIQELPATPVDIDLTDGEQVELEQRRRLGMLIREHATA